MVHPRCMPRRLHGTYHEFEWCVHGMAIGCTTWHVHGTPTVMPLDVLWHAHGARMVRDGMCHSMFMDCSTARAIEHAMNMPWHIAGVPIGYSMTSTSFSTCHGTTMAHTLYHLAPMVPPWHATVCHDPYMACHGWAMTRAMVHVRAIAHVRPWHQSFQCHDTAMVMPWHRHSTSHGIYDGCTMDSP